MNSQNLIKQTLSLPENISFVANLIASCDWKNRSEVTKSVCEHFDFFDVRRKMQIGGCLKALRTLEDGGHYVLPKSRSIIRSSRRPRRLNSPVEEAKDLPDSVGEIAELSLVRVTSTEQMEIWNELMDKDHPQGAGPLVGRQIRYLIGSNHGWIGGLGFAAAALNLADRDRWIGWNGEQRKASLDQIVNMSRFLIRSEIHCRNLASKVLGMSVRQLPEDFEQHYGYKPLLLESFVDTSQFSGACYQAANWIPLGKTKGRGRQDRQHKRELSIKTIYIYPLDPDFRAKLGLNVNAGLGALDPATGLDNDQWAEHEFGGAPLGDLRLSKRLVKVAGQRAEKPGRAYSGVAQGNWPEVKAYYRMIDQPEDSAVNMTNILAPHRERTLRRMQGQKTVLCIQDGSTLNYNNLDKCEGLGEIGSNQTEAKSYGLNLHSTLTIAPNGLPLGVLKATCEAPRRKSKNETRSASQIPIEEKKTMVWIDHHRDLVEVASQMPGVRLVNVCDREADLFELLLEYQKNPRVDLLIRAKHNRAIENEATKLFDTVSESAPQSVVRVDIPRQSARPKKSKQKARAKRPGRKSELTIRYKTVELRSPDHLANTEPVTIGIIHAKEENPPAGAEAAEWFILTTIALTDPAQAEQCLRWYCLRWRIEDWHRVLKSGCRIEDAAHKTAERLKRALAINLVIAWRIMLMTLMGRETPELEAEILFSDIELRVLRAYSKKTA